MDKKQLRQLPPIPRRLALLAREIRGVQRRLEYIVDEISPTNLDEISPPKSVGEISSPFCRYLRGSLCLVTWHRCQVDQVTGSSAVCLFRTWQDTGAVAPQPGQGSGIVSGGILPASQDRQPSLTGHLVNADKTGPVSDPLMGSQEIRTESAET